MSKNKSSEPRDLYTKVYEEVPFNKLVDAKSFVMLAWKTGLIEELVRKELSEVSETETDPTALVEQTRYKIARSWHAFRHHERQDAPDDVAGKLARKVLGAAVVAKKFPKLLRGRQAYEFFKRFDGAKTYLFRTAKQERTYRDELLAKLHIERSPQPLKPAAEPEKTAVDGEHAAEGELALRVDELTGENKAIQEKLDFYQARNKYLDKRMFHFVEENQRLNYELQLEQKNVEELSGRLATHVQECAELERRLSDLTAPRPAQTTAAADHEGTIAETERRFSIVSEEVQVLKQRLEESGIMVTRLKRECSLLRKDNLRLEDQATDYGALGMVNFKERAKLKLKNAKIQSELEALREENAGKRSELKKLRAKKRASKSELAALRAENANHLDALKMEHAKHEATLADRDALVADNDMLREQIARLQAGLTGGSQMLVDQKKKSSKEKGKKTASFFGLIKPGKEQAHAPRYRWVFDTKKRIAILSFVLAACLLCQLLL